MGNRRFDQDFIVKRIKFLNLFINNLVQSESFKSSEILVSFLSYEERGKFDSKFKEYTTQQPSAYVEEYKILMEKLLFLTKKEMKNISLILINISDYKVKF